jgi:hypothetical protein
MSRLVAWFGNRRDERLLLYPLNRLGAKLGNWNDRRNAVGDRRAEHPRRWHTLDRVACWLYTLG